VRAKTHSTDSARAESAPPAVDTYRIYPIVNRFTTRCTPSVRLAMSLAFVRPVRDLTVPFNVTTW